MKMVKFGKLFNYLDSISIENVCDKGLNSFK